MLIPVCCGADCKDLDASCEAWANSGECDNNVAYMIGASLQLEWTAIITG